MEPTTTTAEVPLNTIYEHRPFLPSSRRRHRQKACRASPWLAFVFCLFFIYLQLLLQSESTVHDNNVRKLESTSFHMPSWATEQVHILYGISGTSTEMMDELEVSLKSVLMNAPLRMGL